MRLVLAFAALVGFAGDARADLFTIKVRSVTATRVDGGLPAKVALRRGVSSCNIEKPPGTKPHVATFVGTVTDGKFRAPRENQTGKDKDVVWCVYSELINATFSGDGEHKVVAKVTFTKYKP